MKAAFKLFAGFVSDQGGNGSRKAMAMYICLYFLFLMVNGSLEGKTVDPYLMGSILIIILFCLGAITAEWITKNYKPNNTANEQA